MSNLLIEKTVEYLNKTKSNKMYESRISTAELATTKFGNSRYNTKEAHRTALERDDITPENVAHIIKNGDTETSQMALLHPKAPTENIEDALNNHEKNAKAGKTYPATFPHIKSLLKHPNAPKKKFPHISAAIADHDGKTWKPGGPSTELNIGTQWGGKKIPTSRFD